MTRSVPNPGAGQVPRRAVYAGSNDQKAYALNAAGGHLYWSYDKEASIQASPSATGSTIYIGDINDNAEA
jgi:outer membrane protein assembly factor BamB